MRPSIITFTSSVSDLLYCGHPSVDENFIDCSPREIPWPETKFHWRSPNTDPVKTLKHLKNLLNEYNQPVTWVINDNEYCNLNGTLPYLKQFQEEGDSILITYEIVQRPSPVNRKNTEEVLSYASRKCSEAGLEIDGVWSLKFWNSDIEALLRLSHEFGWAKNIAGACWLQGNHIDDSGWRGCPYGAYYPAVNNIKGCQHPEENGRLVMMHWLTRDFATGISLDRIEPYGLDPADPSRPEIGGFENEAEAGDYLGKLAVQVINNINNSPCIIRINEEVRCYFDEGHNKDEVIRRLYQAIDTSGHNCLKTTIRKAYEIYRQENPEGNNSYLYSGTSLDKRYPKEKVMLYEDGRYQMHFKESMGCYPYRIYNYLRRCKGGDVSDYPVSVFPVISLEFREEEKGIEICFSVNRRCGNGSVYALAVWDRPDLDIVKTKIDIKHIKSHDGNHLLIFNLLEGQYSINLCKEGTYRL